MKKNITYIILGFTFLSCSEKGIEKPKNLIPENKMEEILYDLNLLQAIRNTNYQLFEKENINSEQYIYKKYGIDSLQLVQSNKYYATNTENYEKMLGRVLEKINQEKQKLETSKEQAPEQTKDTLKTGRRKGVLSKNQ